MSVNKDASRSLIDSWLGSVEGVSSSASYSSAAVTFTGYIGSTATSMELYRTVTSSTAAISVTDLHQDGIGDCFLIAAIGELAIYDPALIKNMIVQNANGTQTVTLYANTKGGQPYNGETVFKKVTFTVTDTFASNSVNSSTGQAVDSSNGSKVIWPQVLENAVAQLDGGYSVLNQGGDPAVALEELTGKVAYDYYASGFSATLLKSLSSSGYLITLDTQTSNSTYGTFGNHAYMFDGIQTISGVSYVKALNPWGFSQPSLIPVSQLGTVFQAVTVGHI
jgi:hypothetical protein